MNRSISSFACSRSREPDNYVYRWGCAGSNNVYLLGHAWGVFKPLHDAYTSGRLKVGMKVWYADASGRVTAYAVRWWKVVKPTTAASWAWASQSTRSMTLQTCVGAKSQNRLMVRLTAVRLTAQTIRSPRIRRAITSRWTWLVPSPISVSFASRRKRSTL